MGALGAAGDGAAELEGRQVWVALAAPGDLAVCDVTEDRAEIVAILEPGPDRTPAPCRHYGACGGCALQHLSRGFGAKWKRERLGETLARVGLRDFDLRDTVEVDPASRRRATFAVRRRGGATTLGFNRRRSRDIVDLQACLVLHPALAERIGLLRTFAASVPAPAFDLAVTACVNGLDVAISAARLDPPRGAAFARLAAAAEGAGVIRLTVNGELAAQTVAPVVLFDGIPVEIPPGGFLQASAEAEAAMLAVICAAVGDSRRIADLFCGAGAFALPLARRARVLAVDSDRAALDAVSAAARAAQRRGLALKDIAVSARNLFERPLTPEELAGVDAVVFDPPRAGAKAQAECLAAAGVPRIVAVSCNAATFARDAAILNAGGYRLESATPLDQFVHSAHVEAVGVFGKQG